MSKEVVAERETSLVGRVFTPRRIFTFATSLALAAGGVLGAVSAASATPAVSTVESQVADDGWECTKGFLYDQYNVPVGGWAHCSKSTPPGKSYRARVICQTHEGSTYQRDGNEEVAGRPPVSKAWCDENDVAKQVLVIGKKN